MRGLPLCNLPVFMALAAACVGTVPTHAASSAPAPVADGSVQTSADAQARYDRALAAVMTDMSDPARSFELADAATQSGNIRGAISALEGILLLDPRLSNIKLELGVLYLRAGSPEIAQKFIHEALQDPAAPADVRSRALEYAEVASKKSQQWSVTADVYSGLRYQTNANGVTPNSSIRFVNNLGSLVPGTLEPSARGQPDASAFVSARTQIVYDLGLQSGSSMITNFGYYGSKYFDRNELNLGDLNMDIGPSLVAGADQGRAWNLRPYLSGSLVYKDEELYQTAAGGGLSVSGVIADNLDFFSDTTIQYLDYQITSRYPANNLKDAWSYETSPGLTYALTPTLLLQGSVTVGRVDANASYESYWQSGVRSSLSKAFANPFGLDVPLWTWTLSVGYRNLSYDSRDPIFSLTEAQRDNRYDIGLTIQAPLTKSLAVVGDVRYMRSFSNYDLNNYNNFSTSIGLIAKF
jgi:hypothetical protein